MITATVPDGDGDLRWNDKFAPVSVAIVVEKMRCTILWQAPAPTTYRPGGVILTKKQLSADVDADELKSKIVYTTAGRIVAESDSLPPGRYDVTATVPDDGEPGCYDQCTPAACTIVVEKLKLRIDWKTPKALETANGLFTLMKEKLSAAPDKFSGVINLIYDYSIGDELPASGEGGIALQVEVDEPEKYETESKTVYLRINRLKEDKERAKKTGADETKPGD